MPMMMMPWWMLCCRIENESFAYGLRRWRKRNRTANLGCSLDRWALMIGLMRSLLAWAQPDL